ncbi:50S ribosomal protein L28 [bacterium]|nr:50S ribosomal protein L28 [bacterium]
MSRRCVLTGKSNQVGNTVSHSKRHVKRVQLANIVKKRIFVPSLKRWVMMRISTQALRTMEKVGTDEFLRRQGFIK